MQKFSGGLQRPSKHPVKELIVKKMMEERLMTAKEVCAHLKISKSTWYEGLRRGVYPPGIKIGTRTRRWLASDIEDHLNGSQS